METVKAGFEQVVAMVADALTQINPSIPLRLAEGASEEHTLQTYWHTPPTQFVKEWLGLHALILPALQITAGATWLVRLPGHPPLVSSADVWSGKVTDHKLVSVATPTTRRPRTKSLAGKVLSALEKLMVASLPAILLALVYYKGSTGRLAYLLQPCHLQTVLLLVLATGATSPHGWGAKLFHLYLCTWYGAMLALAMPDTRDQHGLLEIPLFYAEHVVLLALPAVWIAQRRYDLYGGFRPFAFGFLTFFVIHLDVFVPASLLTARNVNYMLVPPRLAVLSHPLLADVPYRGVVGAGCAVLTAAIWALTRCISWASGADAEYAAELAAARAELDMAAATTGAGGVPTLASRPLGGGRGRKAAAAASKPAARAIPSEAALLASPGVGAFDAALAGTMAEGVHADGLIRAAIAAERARAAVAATGVSMKCVRTGLADTPRGPFALVPSPTAVSSRAAAAAAAPPSAAKVKAPRAGKAAPEEVDAAPARRQRAGSVGRSASIGARKRR